MKTPLASGFSSPDNSATDGLSRRQFLATAASVAAATSLASGVLGAATAPQAGGMQLGLFSITFLGLWYRGRELPLDEVVQRAKRYGYEGMEIDGKRPHANPLDWPNRRCRELRKFADGEGIDIYSVAADNDFSSPIPEHRECEVAYVRGLLRMAADFGAGTLRVFLAWPGVTRHPQLGRYDIARPLWDEAHKKFAAEEIWGWCREGMIEAAKYAADFGVTLALQNHKPVINDHRDVLRMVREVGSPNLKVCLDAPIMSDKRPEAVRQAALRCGALAGPVALWRRVRAGRGRPRAAFRPRCGQAGCGQIQSGLRASDAGDRLLGLLGLRIVPSAAQGQRRGSWHRICREECPTGVRIHEGIDEGFVIGEKP